MITLDSHSRRVIFRGQDVGLTIGEYRMFTLLFGTPGKFYSYRELYDVLRNQPGFVAGQGSEGYRTNVRSAIKRIRRKFAMAGAERDRIINYTAYGYGWEREQRASMSCCPTCGQDLRSAA